MERRVSAGRIVLGLVLVLAAVQASCFVPVTTAGGGGCTCDTTYGCDGCPCEPVQECWSGPCYCDPTYGCDGCPCEPVNECV